MSGSTTTTSAEREPIAIIGVSCRLPQAPDPAAFWRLLAYGAEAITDVPAGRWPGEVAHAVRRGGFLADVEGFDAAFFGISPREAAAMDPQQRLALELAWEALEEARVVPDDVASTAVGVFLGAISQEYAALADRLGPDAAGAYTYTGTHRSLIANRVSYVLGLRGPSLTVDSGQSSSLVAVHLACQSLRRGESVLALAGGVDLNLLADTTSVIGRFGALSPDGRCHTFDERANGYVRGEGGALVVLKPLAEAQRDGDRVLAVVLGTAVNNDGGGAGLTAPSQAAQQAVVEAACADAGVDPHEVGYVELHGTGTPVGDPVEAAALGSALGRGRPARDPLLVGSVKTNVGHLEGAAGITGLLKVVLGLTHAQLPASLNFAAANPAIPLGSLRLQVVAETTPWPGPAVAGVSAFGMGGTNCHVILRSAPDRLEPITAVAPGVPWVLSARSAAALAGQAAALRPRVATTPAAALAAALGHGRTAFEHRAVLLGENPTEALTAVAERRPHPDVVSGHAQDGPTVLVFPGQGAQWPEMAHALLEEAPVFTARLQECAAALEPFVDYDLLEVLRGAPGAPDFQQVDVVQPALWAVMVGLAALWAAHGVQPDVVIGHSQGEIAAATVIGALSLSDAARVVALRSRALRAIAGRGGMLSVSAPVSVVQAVLAAEAPDAGVTVAAVNGPGSTVVSGPGDALHALEQLFDAAGYRARPVAVDYASHSAAVEPLRAELLDALAPIRPRSSDVRFVSTLTGAPMDTAGLDADYWYRSLRHPVQFAAAVGQALELGPALIVECSAHPVSVTAVEESAEAAELPVAVLGTLRRGDGGLERFGRALAQAHVAGATVCFAPVGTPTPTRADLVDLPTYAFDRRPYWLPEACPTPRAPAAPAGVRATDDPPPTAVATPTSRELRSLVRALTAEVLGHAEATELDPGRTFKDLGVDSTTAVDLRNRLRAATGLTLATGLLFDHPTPDRVARHLHGLASGVAEEVNVRSINDPGEPAGGDAIAIVAMGCRLPGGITTPEGLWRLLADGGDAITGFPVNRGWDLDGLAATGADRSGTSDTRFGGFLHDADQFDAGFFGISPREALAMDPQQRLLLEVCWEALERGGIDPSGLAGTDTGVFIGAMATDYGPRLHQSAGAGAGHLLTGTALSVVSGRIAYQLGLLGPALTVDTACSSSLVALQLAVRALRSGDCAMALAGGATVMATPGMFVEFSRQGGLAVDGRCKAFSADADGTAWAEGVGVLVLERSCDARRLGHPVLAEIRGLAVNQDGRSNGLTAPHGPSQEQVIRRALADAGLDAGDVDVVEAHGTGTRLGDPIEAAAVQATYGKAHSAQRPLWLGSLKSNLGHTQAAAGIAGVMKMVLALGHRSLPRTLHAEAASPHVDWAEGTVRLLTEAVALPTGTPVRGAVSSFGISGTNAHVVLEHTETPTPAETPAPAPATTAPLVWVLSARTPDALRASAIAFCDHATTASEGDLRGTGAALARRASFAHRAVVVAPDRAQLTAALAALAHGAPHPALVTGNAAPDIRPVFVFPGQGTQWPAMAVELLADVPVFAGSMQSCDEALAPLAGWSLLGVLRGDEGAPELAGSDVIQPVLFAVMVSLAAWWRSVGVEPEAVVGHSQGELAAACAAGALSLADATRIVLQRSRSLMTLTGTGGLVALAVGRARADELIAAWADRLWVAIVNGPENTVVGGAVEALQELEATCMEQGVRARRVAIDYAAHTPHIEAVRADLVARLGTTTPQQTGVAVCSSATGGFVEPAQLTAEFWYTGLRNTVLFDQAVLACAQTDGGAGTRLFVEVSPHPALVGHVQDTLRHNGITGQAIGSLRRGDGGPRRLLTALGEAFTAGATVDWPAVLGAATPPPAGLPTYPFERRRYWIEAPAAGTDAALTGAAGRHPAITSVLPTAADDGSGDLSGEGLLLQATVSRSTLPWLGDHAVAATVLLPGTALVELALAAAEQAGCDLLEDLTLEAPLLLAEEAGVAAGPVTVQISVGAQRPDGRHALSVHSRRADVPGWIRHASGSASATGEGARGVAPATTTAWPPADAAPLDVQRLYDDLASRGYAYGPTFQGVTAAWRTPEADWVEVALPAGPASDAERHLLHPALFDAALHLLVLQPPVDGAAGTPSLPFAWRGVRILRPGAGALRVRLTRTGSDRAAIAAFDGAGNAVLTVEELVLRPLPSTVPAAGDPTLHTVAWVPVTPGTATGADRPATEPTRWAVIDADGVGSGIIAGLQDDGAVVTVCYDLPALADLSYGDPPPVVLVPVLPALAPGAPDFGYDVREALSPVLDLVQAWLGDPRFTASRLVFLTAGALDATCAGGLVSAAVWGLVRSAEAEHPGRFGLLDIPTDTDRTDTDRTDTDPTAATPWAAIGDALAAGEWQLRLHEAVVLGPRIERVPAAGADVGDAAAGSAPEGLVLVTGGTGGLGPLVAERLVRSHGVRHLVLVSRRGPAAPGAAELLTRLAELGAEAVAVACDLSDRGAVRALVAGLPAGAPLTAVVHAAGVTADATVEALSAQHLETVLGPKSDAAWHLHEATEGLPLTRFVSFSSIAGVLGNAGQANYAAANVGLDALAAHRRTRGLPATSIAFGLWAVPTPVSGALGEAGIARLARTGIAPLSTDEGLALFDAAWASPVPLLVAARWSLAGLRSRAEEGTLPPALRGLVPAPRRIRTTAPGAVPMAAATASPDTAGSLVARLVGLAEADARREVTELVRAHVAAVLSQPGPDAVEVDRAFHEMGFDSLTAVELRNRLDRETGLLLSATVAFDHPTVTALAVHLHAALTPAAAAAPAAPPVAAAVAAAVAVPGPPDPEPDGQLPSDEDLFALIDGPS